MIKPVHMCDAGEILLGITPLGSTTPVPPYSINSTSFDYHSINRDIFSHLGIEKTKPLSCLTNKAASTQIR